MTSILIGGIGIAVIMALALSGVLAAHAPSTLVQVRHR